ncbi:dof zinc finger protein DOF1.5 isoform X1 [Manihot esculenta]|uniref:Dof-type domain-containing protein n=1 Tax=Manihot esculenta TaxID=3983 RepID=A0A2C9U8L3_MANES|nr:dof zinc finger protein DOF1.5 isoform X1 [Manihot esculenta]OAY26335.1 hypothetical protein MANES_16G039600v8 [Manihot esculenta]
MATQEVGIKLFGTTITLHARQIKEDQNNQENPSPEKRPEKIISCPRCKSMETKFCYFNNYNVNQPRHFCKGCQRYWTAGGALRNVPVGAGRRKNKPPCRGGLGGFPEGCLYDGSGDVHQIELDSGLLLKEWLLVADDGSRHVYPMKRRRRSSDQHEAQ